MAAWMTKESQIMMTWHEEPWMWVLEPLEHLMIQMTPYVVICAFMINEVHILGNKGN